MTAKVPDPLTWFDVLQQGQCYMKTWPIERRLSPVFPENRVVVSTRFALRFMPPLAIFTLIWQIALGGQAGPAVAVTLFACSLPLQGLWWLGKRSATPLPAALLPWFYEIQTKLMTAGQTVTPFQHTPTYRSLAELLKCAFKQLDKTFLDDL